MLACVAAVAMAAPQADERPVVELLSDQREHAEDGTFKYSFSTDNNINIAVTGTQGAEGSIYMEGTFWLVNKTFNASTHQCKYCFYT